MLGRGSIFAGMQRTGLRARLIRIRFQVMHPDIWPRFLGDVHSEFVENYFACSGSLYSLQTWILKLSLNTGMLEGLKGLLVHCECFCVESVVNDLRLMRDRARDIVPQI